MARTRKATSTEAQQRRETIDRMRTEDLKRSDLQQGINKACYVLEGRRLSAVGHAHSVRWIADTIRKQAEKDHAEYPQYKDHWNGWVLVRIGACVRGKGGIYFERGDYAIASTEVRDVTDIEGNKFQSRMVYSVRDGNTCAVRELDVAVIPPTI